MSIFTAIRDTNLEDLNEFLDESDDPADLLQISPFSPTSENNTLHLAARHGSRDIVEALLNHAKKYGSDYFDEYINSQNRSGSTALWLSAHLGRQPDGVVSLLIGNHANLDLSDNDGDTPLHVSTSNLHGEITKLLIDAGARFDIANNDGEIVIENAHKSNDKQTYRLILSKMKAGPSDILLGRREKGQGITKRRRKKRTHKSRFTRRKTVPVPRWGIVEEEQQDAHEQQEQKDAHEQQGKADAEYARNQEKWASKKKKKKNKRRKPKKTKKIQEN